MTLGFQSEATLGFSVQMLTSPISEGLVGILGSYSKQSQIAEESGLCGRLSMGEGDQLCRYPQWDLGSDSTGGGQKQN